MSKKSIILIIIGIFIVGISVIFASNTNQDVIKHDTIDSPNVNDSTIMDINKPDSFINENGTKTYVINAIDSPIMEP